MSRKGRKFEVEYQKYYNMLNPSIFTVESPCYLTDRITGVKREVDILIRFHDESNIERKISIECRDRPNTIQDVTWIEQLVTKKNDLGIDITIASTTKSFSQPAIIKAKAYGIIVEESEIIDEPFIRKLSYAQYFTISMLLVKAYDITIFDNNGRIFMKKEVKKTTTKTEKLRIEEYINESILWSESFYNVFKNTYKLEHNGIICPNLIYTLNINTTNSAPQNLFHKYNIFQIKLKVKTIPFNIKIPLLEGLIINNPESKSLSGYRKGYGNSDIELQEVKHPDLFKFHINFKNILSNNLKLIGYLPAPYLHTMKFNAGSQIELIQQGLKADNFLGRIDFKAVWN